MCAWRRLALAQMRDEGADNTPADCNLGLPLVLLHGFVLRCEVVAGLEEVLALGRPAEPLARLVRASHGRRVEVSAGAGAMRVARTGEYEYSTVNAEMHSQETVNDVQRIGDDAAARAENAPTTLSVGGRRSDRK